MAQNQQKMRNIKKIDKKWKKSLQNEKGCDMIYNVPVRQEAAKLFSGWAWSGWKNKKSIKNTWQKGKREYNSKPWLQTGHKSTV